MASRTQQSKETKSIIAKYKRLIDTVESEEEKRALIKKSIDGVFDSIQRQKILKSLIDYI